MEKHTAASGCRTSYDHISTFNDCVSVCLSVCGKCSIFWIPPSVCSSASPEELLLPTTLALVNPKKGAAVLAPILRFLDRGLLLGSQDPVFVFGSLPGHGW